MAGSFTFDPEPSPLAEPAVQLVVSKYVTLGIEDADNLFLALPNVECLRISYAEGATPPTALFRYILDERAVAAGWPTQFEQVMPLNRTTKKGSKDPQKSGRFIVGVDTRIVVHRYLDDGTARVMFDGFAAAPQANLSAESHEVTFQATGTAIRLWDTPIVIQWIRDADKVTTPGDDSPSSTRRYVRGVPIVLNPQMHRQGVPELMGNCTPDDRDETQDGFAFPIFTDPSAPQVLGAYLQTKWTLAKLAKYLMGAYNSGQKFVDNPDFSGLTKLLNNRRPKDGADTYDPSNSDTYQEDPIELPTADVTGRPWPEVLDAQLRYNGFAMAFRTEDDGGGNNEPWNYIELYRKDGAGPYAPKSIPFQAARSVLDPTKSAVGSIAVARDYRAVHNAVFVRRGPTLVELSVVLTPGFAVAGGDNSPDNLKKYDLANLANADAATYNAYRRWVADEIGTDSGTIKGGAAYASGQVVPPLDLTEIYQATRGGRGVVDVHQRRPGRYSLISKDDKGVPRLAYLSFSRDYTGDVNKLWDGTGTWQDIPKGHGWQILHDRLGVWISCQNPEKWPVGRSSGAVEQSIVLKAVTSVCNPDDANQTVFLRLTTVIEVTPEDHDLFGPRSSSPLKYQRVLYADARESFWGERIHRSSPHYAASSGAETNGHMKESRDDAKKLDAYGTALRSAHEVPPIAGTIVIPWITDGYAVGDQISTIQGRDLSLQLNAATEAGEGKRYPHVVGVDWNFAGRQETVLHLSTAVTDPRPGRTR